MSREKKKSLFLPLSLLVVALAVLGSVPFLTSRATAVQQREAAAKAAAVQAEAARDPKSTTSALGGTLKFDDVEKQSKEFIVYYHTIKLTPQQEAIKAEVLRAMPAACCRESSAYTCCCPCNLSKTLWGLSNYVIAKKGVNAAQLKEVVDAWMSATNQKGYSGDSCYQGGCEREFHKNGCGGMNESTMSV